MVTSSVSLRWRVSMVVTTLLTLFVLVFSAGFAAPTKPPPVVVRRAIIVQADGAVQTRVPAPPLRQRPAGATFVVNYIGFSPEAQAAFQYAVDLWAGFLTSSVPIRVEAKWEPLGGNVLGSAGASYTLYNGSWHPYPLVDKLSGSDVDPSKVDIEASFSSEANWYFGTDGNTPADKTDFVSVVLHELGHGLGFNGSMNVQGELGSWGYPDPPNVPFIFDRFAVNGAEQQLINTTLFPNPSEALAQQLQSNNLFWNGPNGVAANGGVKPRLYAPSVWEDGSSFAHLDENTYQPGNPNSLMTPAIAPGESIHNPGPITLGIFTDIGWSLGGTTPTSTVPPTEIPTSTVPPTGIPTSTPLGPDDTAVFLPQVIGP